MVRIKEKNEYGYKLRTDWLNLDKKVENKNKTGWERRLRTTTESKQKQTKTKKWKNTDDISDTKRE